MAPGIKVTRGAKQPEIFAVTVLVSATSVVIGIDEVNCVEGKDCRILPFAALN